jgi:hypothetical protein
MKNIDRRTALHMLVGMVSVAGAAYADSPRELEWEDLIPPGVPYAEIIDVGTVDLENDVWRPVYDANGTKFNEALDGAFVRLPGFIVPIELGPDGVTEFLLAPYAGACIHTPPPPPNQLVLVRSAKPWPADDLWDPVWVEGWMRAQPHSTNIAEAGYFLSATFMEIYEW